MAARPDGRYRSRNAARQRAPSLLQLPEGDDAAVQAGEAATFDGTVDLIAVPAPSLADGNLVLPPKK